MVPDAGEEVVKKVAQLVATGVGPGGEQIDVSAARERYADQIGQLGLEKAENDALLKFIQFMLNSKMINENLLKGFRHFKFDNDTQDALLRSMTQEEKKAINSAFKKIYSDKDKLEAFLSLFDKKDEPAAEEPKADEKGVVELPSEEQSTALSSFLSWIRKSLMPGLGPSPPAIYPGPDGDVEFPPCERS